MQTVVLRFPGPKEAVSAAAQMAAANEDWSAWEGAVSDGTNEL